MPFTLAELENIQNSALETYLDKGVPLAQNIQSKPMWMAFDAAADTFTPGNEYISGGVRDGAGGGSLQWFDTDDTVNYYNPTNNKRWRYRWRQGHLGLGLTHHELLIDGIGVTETAGGGQSTSEKSEREMQAISDIYQTKIAEFDEDYNRSMNSMVHGDGTGDAKSIAGLRSLLLDSPNLGSTGGISRVANTWWRNRAATAAFAADGGRNAITSNTANGGALLQFLEEERMQIRRFARGAINHKCFAGSDFINAMKREIRANGYYSQTGFGSTASNDGAMANEDGIKFGSWDFVYDPTLDDLGRNKYAYIIDFNAIKLSYAKGEKKKRFSPTRPYDKYMIYSAVRTVGVMKARQLNTSGIYAIA